MTLTVGLDLDRVKVNQLLNIWVKGHYCLKVMVSTQIHTHTWPSGLPRPLKWSIISRVKGGV